MSIDFALNAELRTDKGKAANRRLRHAGKVPAVLYGADKNPVPIALDHNQLLQNLKHEAFCSHVLTIRLDGKSEKAIVRDVQRHPAKPSILHMDLQRVKATEALRMNVPLRFIGEEVAVGVKREGGIILHNMVNVEIECLPKNLPEYIEVDVSELHLGDSMHLTDLKMPAGVKLVDLLNIDEISDDERNEVDQPVVSIQHKAKEVVVEEAEVVEGIPEAAAAAAEEQTPAGGGEK